MTELNVVDEMKNWPQSRIEKFVRDNSFPASILMLHINGDFNISSIVRSANAFGFRNVYYVGKKRWDRRGAVGTHNYTPMTYFPTFEDAHNALCMKVDFIALENDPNFPSKSIYDFQFPLNTCLVVGEENAGVPADVLEKCSATVRLPQYGSVRSTNVASAATTAMNFYGSQWYSIYPWIEEV